MWLGFLFTAHESPTFLFLYILPVIIWLQCALCVSQPTKYSAACQKIAAFKVKQGWKIWTHTIRTLMVFNNHKYAEIYCVFFFYFNINHLMVASNSDQVPTLLHLIINNGLVKQYWCAAGKLFFCSMVKNKAVLWRQMYFLRLKTSQCRISDGFYK